VPISVTGVFWMAGIMLLAWQSPSQTMIDRLR
jgi:hypothetical protein